MATNETDITIGDLNIPFGAGIGISETLQPIDNGDLRRSINGDLVDLTRPENRKFEYSINGGDSASPAIAALWKGTVITPVIPVTKLRENVAPAGLSVTLTRPPLVSSVMGYVAATCTKVAPDTIGGTDNKDITFLTNVDYVEYRAEFTFMVVGNSVNVDEYAATEGYSIDFEEV
jgi:hypothetical protein